MACSDEASHSSSENRGFCADKVHRLVRSPHIFNRTCCIVPATAITTATTTRHVLPLIHVFDVPPIVLIRVVIRISALVPILFLLVAVLVCHTAVILRVAFHPFNRNALAGFLVNAINHRAHEVTPLSEGLRCHSGCQDGESFHIQICNYNQIERRF